MHEACYASLGLSFTYVPFKVRSLQGALAGMRGLGIRGFGVSHPFKQKVMELLDALDPVAQRIGAVNTIVNDDGHLVGYNTDWVGAVRALEEVCGAGGLAGARVLLVGAGGGGQGDRLWPERARSAIDDSESRRSKGESSRGGDGGTRKDTGRDGTGGRLRRDRQRNDAGSSGCRSYRERHSAGGPTRGAVGDGYRLQACSHTAT